MKNSIILASDSHLWQFASVSLNPQELQCIGGGAIPVEAQNNFDSQQIYLVGEDDAKWGWLGDTWAKIKNYLKKCQYSPETAPAYDMIDAMMVGQGN